ncbi:FACT complex subunit spt16, partial [Bonamia ostreae]
MPQDSLNVGNLSDKIDKLRSVQSSFTEELCSIIIVSESSSVDSYAKSSAVFIWLFGFDIPGSVLVYSFENKMLHLFSDKYANSNVFGDSGDLKTEKMSAFEESVKDEKFGTKKSVLFLKNKSGELFQKVFATIKSNFLLVECNSAVGKLLSVKTGKERNCAEKAANLCSAVYKYFLVPKIETVIDEDIKITHSTLSKSTEKIINTPNKVQINLNPDFVESCYSPIIQSGGEYNMKLSAESTSNPLKITKNAPVLISLGVRYKSYCCNMSRSLMFDPSEEQKRVYNTALCAFEAAVDALKPGTEVKRIWEIVRNVVEDKYPEKVDKLMKNCGFGIGIQFREPGFVIHKSNANKIENGMIFNLSVGFENLEDTISNTPYAIQIADTVVVEQK